MRRISILAVGLFAAGTGAVAQQVDLVYDLYCNYHAHGSKRPGGWARVEIAAIDRLAECDKEGIRHLELHRYGLNPNGEEPRYQCSSRRG